MRFIPIGIANNDHMEAFLDPSDYSDGHYDSIRLRKAPNNNVVLIMRSKGTSPMDWKVVYGFSSVFFKTFEEAAEFCNDRRMTLVKGEPGYDEC